MDEKTLQVIDTSKALTVEELHELKRLAAMSKGAKLVFAMILGAVSLVGDAYRAAYDAANMRPETINRKAYELMGNGKITAMIDTIKAELEETGLWTREQSVKALVSVIQQSGKSSDVVSAVKELNAMHGYNAPQKIAQTNPDGTPVAPMPTRVEIVNLTHDYGTDSDTA